jgi:cell wall assembly regulator SMI1
VTLESALRELEAALAPAVATTLRPGIADPALARLAKVIGALPPELVAWFRWHDGQAAPRPIDPGGDDTLLAAAAVAEAWQYLKECGGKPWRSTWVPLLGNEAGDHVVYDRSSGAVLRYHHDDRRRPELAPSLEAWTRAIAARWRAR